MKIKEIDFNDIKEIVVDYMKYFNDIEGDHWTEENVLRRLKQLTIRFDYFGLGIYDGSRIIGFCVGNLSQFDDGVIMHLNEIFVISELQSKGYGSKLLIEFEKKAKELGAFRIQLEAVDDDIHSRFYNQYHRYVDTSSNLIKAKAI
ncbi:MAG: GNAT family N-acetyltransferase [Candidatus Izemoplasmatales bacterium]|uniref:GNAT family N-acetyltransferase n=1 Tax=Hujiaoplasma nucleasis TaxID=2725268 RepID=A0A7L6N4I2_9MOLU|nr:GNAT family N-acetyltransferase [Hujiaoplasma nucleasis]QLY40148.1 GNAT family N-acetyltransferase [Hujiaoplasma nucleasis]